MAEQTRKLEVQWRGEAQTTVDITREDWTSIHFAKQYRWLSTEIVARETDGMPIVIGTGTTDSSTTTRPPQNSWFNGTQHCLSTTHSPQQGQKAIGCHSTPHFHSYQQTQGQSIGSVVETNESRGWH